MSSFIVIHKKSILKYLFLILVFTSISLLLFFNLDSIAAFRNSIIENDSKKLDFNGDGILDTLTIDEKKESYRLKITCNDMVYNLTPNSSNSSLGSVTKSFPLHVNYINISRNSIPQILATGLINGKPVTHIFMWNSDSFDDIFCSSNNLIGILDSDNNKTPILLSLSSNKGDSSTISYILDNYKLRDISFSKTTVPGIRNLQLFIDTVEKSYEISESPDIFTENIDSSELSILWSLNKEGFNYSFQHGFFHDTKWDKSSNTKELIWDLSFEKKPKISGDNKKEEIRFLVTFTKVADNNFKISSIKVNKSLY